MTTLICPYEPRDKYEPFALFGSGSGYVELGKASARFNLKKANMTESKQQNSSASQIPSIELSLYTLKRRNTKRHLSIPSI